MFCTKYVLYHFELELQLKENILSKHYFSTNENKSVLTLTEEKQIVFLDGFVDESKYL